MERKDVLIKAPAAPLALRAPAPYSLVYTGEEGLKLLDDPSVTHVCPLCNQEFLGLEFRRHAPYCVLALGPGWERQRDREPYYREQKRLNTRTVFPMGGGDD